MGCGFVGVLVVIVVVVGFRLLKRVRSVGSGSRQRQWQLIAAAAVVMAASRSV